MSGVNCGSPWSQTFTYDTGLSTSAFGNLTKSGSQSFSVTYDNNNHVTTFNYDANGNVTQDNLGNTYTWDANWQVMTSFNGAGNFTYDALGRMVEANSQPILYSPVGRIARLAAGGASYVNALIPTAAGPLDYISTSSVGRIDHVDWLGSSRFMSNPQTNVAVGAIAYAPFGEDYSKVSAMRRDFTNQFQDSSVANLYDFSMRKLNVVQGRWLSPDPARLAAVDLKNPQTLNAYAYVANRPLENVDPDELQGAFPENACQLGTKNCYDSAHEGPNDLYQLVMYFAFTPTKGYVSYTIDPEFPFSEDYSKLFVSFVYGNIGLLNLLNPENFTVHVTAPDPAALNQPSLTSQAAMVQIHNVASKFPEICGFKGSLSGKAGPLSIDVGDEGVHANIEGKGLGTDIENPSNVSVSVGDGVGASLGLNLANHTVTSIGVFAGIRSKFLEASAHIDAIIGNMFGCHP